MSFSLKIRNFGLSSILSYCSFLCRSRRIIWSIILLAMATLMDDSLEGGQSEATTSPWPIRSLNRTPSGRTWNTVQPIQPLSKRWIYSINTQNLIPQQESISIGKTLLLKAIFTWIWIYWIQIQHFKWIWSWIRIQGFDSQKLKKKKLQKIQQQKILLQKKFTFIDQKLQFTYP